MRLTTVLSSAIALAAVALAAPSALVPAASAASVLTIGTAQPGTITNSAGSALAKVMKEKRGVEVRVQPFAGSGPLMALVQQGKLDLAIVNVFEMAQAMNGEPPFEDKAPDLRVVSSLFQSYVGFLVPKDSPIKTLPEIAGKRIPSGFSAAPIIEPMRKAIFANAGVTDDQVTLVPVPNSVRSADLMQQGRLDIAFLSIGSGKVNEIDAALGGIRFLSLSSEPKDVAAMRKVMPQALVVPLKAAPNLAGIADGTNVMGYDFVLVTNKNTKAEVVKDAIDVLSKNRADLGAALPHFKRATDQQMAAVPGLPYHTAALETFKAMGVAQ
ncbi:MAG TPA: TAXI family TRAP transporter solute-binding subunit [Alphaproteobacteria bacterium]